MGIFFSDQKKRVIKEEWRLVRGILYSKYNFTEKELDRVEEIFRGDMDEEGYNNKGVSADEIVKGIRYMRDHLNDHHILPKKIDALEFEMIKKL